jgi:hypothetical protein
MAQEKEYLINRERVFEIYGIPKKERGTRYTMHHIVYRSDVGKLVPSTFRVNELSNLYPLERQVHEELHRRVDLPGDKKCPDLKRRRRR